MPARLNKNRVGVLVLFHIAVIALANYAVQFSAAIAGVKFTWGMFVFPLVILATDLTVRFVGARSARVIVGCAYLPALAISVWLAGGRIGFASAAAYLLGQLLDITVFQKIRARSAQNKTQQQRKGNIIKPRERWYIAPFVSTLCANIVDTYAFFALAFYRATDPYMARHWLEIAHADLGFKVVVSVLIFLPIYGVLLATLQRRLRLD